MVEGGASFTPTSGSEGELVTEGSGVASQIVPVARSSAGEPTFDSLGQLFVDIGTKAEQQTQAFLESVPLETPRSVCSTEYYSPRSVTPEGFTRSFL